MSDDYLSKPISMGDSSFGGAPGKEVIKECLLNSGIMKIFIIFL